MSMEGENDTRFNRPYSIACRILARAKTTKQAAEAKLKLTEAEARSKILLSEKTSVADWERIMAQGAKFLEGRIFSRTF